MAELTCGEERCGRCTGTREISPAASNEEPYSSGAHSTRERPMANARQAWWLSRDRFEGMVPSGIDQRRMGGLYRVDGSGANEDPAIDRSIETPLETSYNCPVWPRSKP